jgi:predicted lipase
MKNMDITKQLYHAFPYITKIETLNECIHFNDASYNRQENENGVFYYLMKYMRVITVQRSPGFVTLKIRLK